MKRTSVIEIGGVPKGLRSSRGSRGKHPTISVRGQERASKNFQQGARIEIGRERKNYLLQVTNRKGAVRSYMKTSSSEAAWELKKEIEDRGRVNTPSQ